jgi:hypothetical protein
MAREQIEALPAIWRKCSSITSLEMNSDEYIVEFIVTLTLHRNQ